LRTSILVVCRFAEEHFGRLPFCRRAFWSLAVLLTSILVVRHFADEHFGHPSFCGQAFWSSAVSRMSILVVRRFDNPKPSPISKSLPKKLF
jgi:hypothetical protein